MAVERTSFGNKLKQIRQSRGILAIQFARSIGCTPSFVSSVETGRKPVPTGWTKKIAEIYTLAEDEENALLELAGHSKNQFVFTPENFEQVQYLVEVEKKLNAM